MVMRMSTSMERLARAVIWAAAIALTAGTAASAPAFHAAQSAAEQALGRILKADENPPGHIDPVGGAVIVPSPSRRLVRRT
jgi:hypothetical protein